MEAQEQKKIDPKRAGLAGLLLLIIVVSVVLIFSSNSGTKAPKPEHSKAAAWTMMEEFVKARLKSPASAKFPWYSEDLVKDLGNGRYVISAYVDSQNSFGAMLRTNFVCTVKYIGNDKWELEDLKITN